MREAGVHVLCGGLITDRRSAPPGGPLRRAASDVVFAHDTRASADRDGQQHRSGEARGHGESQTKLLFIAQAEHQ
jgi:hypothetical protein